MFKRNNVITVANLQAFGVVCYAQETKQILLIPKRKEALENKEGKANVKEMVETYSRASGLGNTNQLFGLVFYFLVFIGAMLLLTSSVTIYPKDIFSYLIFFLLSVVSGVALGNLVFSEVHKSLRTLEFKEISCIDDEIGAVLKKKLKRDVLISVFLPLIIVASFICVPFSLDQYLSYLPVSVSSFLLIGLASFVIYGIYTVSPPLVKLQAYKKVKELIAVYSKIPHDEIAK